MKNSKIILVRDIKLDKEYRNVLNYTNEQMLQLCTQNMINSASNYSFIKKGGNQIDVAFTYEECLEANYIAFQNPSYSNKWFFAFINDIEYRSDKNTRITFTVDDFSTWYGYWDYHKCFVIREHVTDDSIGTHTIPEGLETGDYITAQNCTKILANPSDFYICMAVTELPDESIPGYASNRVYNGIFGGLFYLVFKTAKDCQTAIRMYDIKNKANAINSIFMVPKNLTAIKDGQNVTWTIDAIGSCNLIYVNGSDSADTIGNLVGTMPTKLGKSYIPKNKKLFTYPYSFMNLTNNSGMTESYRYEDFTVDNGERVIGWWINACISPGMSLKAIPLFYKEININYNYGLMGGKLPVCSWNSDIYLNWISQQGLNLPLSIANSVLGTALSLGTNNVAGAMSGLSSVYNSIHQITVADMQPNQARGNTNSGDVNFSDSNDGGFTLYYMSIKDEYAKIIDDYFTMFGYKVDSLKIPNYNTRTYWNFIQIADSEDIGYSSNNISVPPNAMDNINNIFRKGVTIWHNHSNLGNYSLDNSI